MTTTNSIGWQEPKGQAAMTEEKFDETVRFYGSIFPAVLAAKVMSVSLNTVKAWTAKHLKK